MVNVGSSKVVVVADLSISPIGLKTTSVSRYVAAAVKAVKAVKDIRCLVTPMGTVLEAERLDTILEAVKAAHGAVFKLGVNRIETTLRIDDRRDKPRTMEDKVDAVERYLSES